MLTRLFNTAWIFQQNHHYSAYYKNIKAPGKTQYALLKKYLANNANTLYGRKYSFAKIDNYQAFKDAVPIIEDYDELKGYIDKISRGDKNILCKEDIQFYENTSGSTSSSKWIPYTRTLKQEFQKAIAVWMCDLYKHKPQIFHGKAYWSVSPFMKPSFTTSGGLLVGMDSDTDYFNSLTTFFLNRILAVPQQVKTSKTAHEFYVRTCRYLLSCPKLRFISIWSPNFFLQLDHFMRDHYEEILKHTPLPSKQKSKLAFMLQNEADWKTLFPDLSLLSCWTDAQAAIWIPALKKRLGQVDIQGKGLMLTEGVITIPQGFDEHLLAYRSHFYEFREMKTGKVKTLEHLLQGENYEMIITTGGGLYRYNTKDIVQLKRYHYGVPVLEFLGRGSRVSDLVGEKVSEYTLNALFSRLTENQHNHLEGMYLFPQQESTHARYKLILEGGTTNEREMVREVEKHLLQNPYYQQALSTGQLLPLTAMPVKPGFTEALTNYYKNKYAIKDGELKLPLLLPYGLIDHFNRSNDKN